VSKFLLAIDVGTSALKAALFSQDGALIGASTQSYEVYYPQPGWVEQKPEDWWRAACAAIRALLHESGVSPPDIVGVGIDGQSWSCIPVREDGAVLARTPIWMDTRAAGICERVVKSVGAERIFSVAGNPFQPSYTTPKILWFRENRPEVYRDAAFFLQSNSFIVHRLTGVFSQDICQGYGLHVFDMAHLCYDEPFARELGIDLRKLPPLYACDQVVGGVTREAAALTGLREGTPVVAGGLDAACGTLGAGVYKKGQTQEQGGQAGGMSICLSAPIADPALILSTHVIPGLWLLQGGTVGGGGSLNWMAREFAQPERERAKATGGRMFSLLDELAESVPPGAEGVIFLPYLAGERSPIWDPNACGVFFGLSYDKSRAHFFRAALEGAAFALRHNLEVAEHAGVPVEIMHAMGGAANSLLWTQIKADVTGKEILVPDSDAATVRGAAILAGVGVGVYAGFGEAVEKTVRFTRRHTPDESLAAVYEDAYQTYLEIYRRLKPVMAETAARRERVR